MKTDRPIIILCPVKNEESNLKRMVPTWLLFADHIIVADQGSTDKTLEVLKEFSKVKIIHNPDDDFSEPNRVRLLVQAARQISKEAILVYLDADETLSANILQSPEWKSFCQSEPGTSGDMLSVQLWKEPYHYLTSGPLSNYRSIFAFIDDGRTLDETLGKGQRLHLPRGIGFERPLKIFHFNEIVCLHFGWMNFRRSVIRNHWYKAWYLVHGAKSYHVTNRNHSWFYKVTPAELSPTPQSWLAGYTEKGYDVTSTENPDLLWYEVDILRWIEQYGAKKFFLLDIWREVDWEAKRKTALSMGIPGIPSTPIGKPPKWMIVFNGLGYGDYTFCGILRKLIRGLLRLILP